MIKNFLALLVLGGALWVGARRAGPLPPVGPLLDPAHGVWAAAAHVELPATATDSIPGMAGSVTVNYDQRGVPHIFATTEEDVFRALGYVVARDRLFQLELQARAGAGTLTELVGPAALPSDAETRSLGLPRAAERHWQSLAESSEGRRYANAYAEGVNAWIDRVSPALLPVEYKILGRKPARWEPINTLHMVSRMAFMLSWFSDDLNRLAAEAAVGRAATASVFPLHATIGEPIQPATGTPTFDYSAIVPPGTPDSAAVALLPTWHVPGAAGPDGDPRIFASNNWAVGPSRSASGHALLAGDPHLGLTLPSIWYETHLVVPGRIDVAGVTIPGAPGVLIGFTRNLAWSLTNTGADVVDFYREIVDDHADPRRYMLDNAWRDIELREEAYRDGTGRVLRRDTVRFTHRGPMRLVGKEWVSTRWTALESADLTGFVRAARQETTTAFLDTLAATFTAPAQNVIVADRSGNIAIRSTGHYPLQPDGTTGERLRDGTASASDWQGYWPVTSYPQSFNPTQGYLASANQSPLLEGGASRYLGPSSAFDPWRALHINRLLRSKANVTVDNMREWQTDPGSARADHFAPWFLAAARKAIDAGTATPTVRQADSALRAWDRQYRPDSRGTVLFEAALRELQRRTWDEFTASPERRVRPPGTDQLLRLLADSANLWWDVRKTSDRVEQRDDVIVGALAAAWDSVSAVRGAPGASWEWRIAGAANVDHLLRLGGFGRRGLVIRGGPGTLNPSGPSSFGASWRMVVELADTVKAWGTYPGGQSGNPASSRYDDRLGVWSSGSLEPLVVPRTAQEMSPANVRASLHLEKR